VYPQLWGDFIPDLSAFDLLFNCGPKAREIVLAAYQRKISGLKDERPTSNIER
jgi:hypothetical protein